MKVLSKRIHLNDNTTEFVLQTQKVETKLMTLMTSNLFSILHSIRGVFFSLISESSVWRNEKIN